MDLVGMIGWNLFSILILCWPEYTFFMMRFENVLVDSPCSRNNLCHKHMYKIQN
jgi:hypothetical protein